MQLNTQQHTILIAGCGDVGSTLGQLLTTQGKKVIGLRRNINQLPQGIQGISADLSQFDDLKAKLQDIHCDIVVYAASAPSFTPEDYQQTYVDGLKKIINSLDAPPKHLFFTSSSGVYHQNDHSWVDEQSPCLPSTFSGQIMLEAEETALSTEYPATVVRFTGIYGPGRNHLLNRVSWGDAAPNSPIQFTNRIHRDDCAGVLAHLITKALAGEPLETIYLATDDTPATMYDVTHWMAQRLNTKITSESATRRAGSKRCSNRRLKESGYIFKYPNYKEGYTALLK
ncbi:SDR family oxidoreductase [Neptuniibacter marinus]|uniref:SDR family oxidoreductase n=1 Tax=Neptuniibacter marinus TaxID=1806670 RepID=UPI003B5C956D